MAIGETHRGAPQFTRQELGKRFDFHPAGSAAGLHDAVRKEIKYLAGEINGLIPDGREKALVMTALEEAMFWANAAIARSPELHNTTEETSL